MPLGAVIRAPLGAIFLSSNNQNLQIKNIPIHILGIVSEKGYN
jgi:hypothetical protein